MKGFTPVLLAIAVIAAVGYVLVWMGESPTNNEVVLTLLRRDYFSVTGWQGLLFCVVVGWLLFGPRK